MPWSEWQSPFVDGVSPIATFLTWHNNDSEVAQIENPWSGGVSVGESTDWQRFDTDTTVLQFTASDTWEQYRPKYPPLLEGMEQGVDYDVIPGREQWQDDAFVDWDPLGFNQHQGWTDPNGGVHTLEVTGQGSWPTAAWSASAGVGVTRGTRYPTEPVTGNVGERPVPDDIWGSGDTGSSDGTGRTELYDLGTFPDGLAGDQLSFSLVVQASVDLLSDGPNDGATGGGHVAVFPVDQKVLLPAWRYWIPGDIPLRQRQRDDGLGLSAARWRKGRSLQASNRWKGYL